MSVRLAMQSCSRYKHLQQQQPQRYVIATMQQIEDAICGTNRCAANSSRKMFFSGSSYSPSRSNNSKDSGLKTNNHGPFRFRSSSMSPKPPISITSLSTSTQRNDDEDEGANKGYFPTQNNDITKDADDLIARITKQEVSVNKDKPWLFDLGIRQMLPEWKNMFQASTLMNDVTAGITVGCVAVPLSLAIAVASGVPPEVGLVTAAVSGVAGGLMGGTTLAITGPAAAISLLVVGAVQEHGLEALPVITLACGGLQVLSGVTRQGTLAKLVPVSVIAGFTTGVGAMILSGQIPKALGMTAPAGLNPVETLGFITENVASINPAAAALALGTSAGMLLLPKIHPKMPAALLAVGGATVATHSLGLDVASIGAIPSGLDAFQMVVPTLPPIAALPSLGITTFLIFAMTSAESLLSCAALEKMKKTSYKHNPDQELVGQGIANIGAGMFLGMPVTSVIARSGLNVKLNAESRLPSLVQSAFVFSSVVFFSSTIATIPMPALSGMLIMTGVNMLNPAEFKHCFAVQKLDAIPFAATIGGMVLFGLAEGIGIGCLSAWALNYDHGALNLKEVKFPHKGSPGAIGNNNNNNEDNAGKEIFSMHGSATNNAVIKPLDPAVLQDQISTVNTQNLQLRGRVLTLQNDSQHYQGVIGTLQAENAHLTSRLEVLEMENEQLRGLFDTLTEKLEDDADGSHHTKSTLGWQLKGPINFASMFKIDDLIHRIEEMTTDEKVIVLDMQETTAVEFTGVEELVNRLVEVADQQHSGTVEIQMWNCDINLLNALRQCDPNERILRFARTDTEESPFHFPAKEMEPERQRVPTWYDSPNFRP